MSGKRRPRPKPNEVTLPPTIPSADGSLRLIRSAGALCLLTGVAFTALMAKPGWPGLQAIGDLLVSQAEGEPARTLAPPAPAAPSPLPLIGDASTAPAPAETPSPATLAAVDAPPAALIAAELVRVRTIAVNEHGQPDRLIVVRNGDTLGDILAQARIDDGEAAAAVDAIRNVFDLRRLRQGQSIELGSTLDTTTGQRHLTRVGFDIDTARALELTRADDGAFTIETVDRELTSHTVVAAGTIDGSLSQSAEAAGLPVAAVPAIVKLFSWDVDFQRDLQPGDRFEAIYDHMTDDAGHPSGLGVVTFAALHLDGKLIQAYRFERADGSTDYYGADGRPLRKWLLRTPVDGARISSTFGARRHPVLGFTRMHKGVDFAAPRGTPIFAAGDGTVEFVGRGHGYGNMVKVRHNGEYSTAYGHMSRFAAGLRRGERVKQGQIIGYVGMTGLATGPHLHYEVLKDGTQINPLSVKTVDQARLQGRDLQRFMAEKAEVDARVRRADETLLAQNGG